MAKWQLLGACMAMALQLVASKAVPGNLASFINRIQAAGNCQNPISDSFFDKDSGGGRSGFVYCKDNANPGIVFIKGPGRDLADMDVDCDGALGPGSDCNSGGDTQGQTSFKNIVSTYGISDLDASLHSFVVFGNDNSGNLPGFGTFRPQDHGIEPLSIMAVVCNGKLLFGVWGDENGNDGQHSVIGEASLGLGRLCFGDGMSNESGHDEADVMYIAFSGADAVPGRDGAAWKARSRDEFQNDPRFNALGDALVQGIQG